jgi:hypothetical protein
MKIDWEKPALDHPEIQLPQSSTFFPDRSPSSSPTATAAPTA